MTEEGARELEKTDKQFHDAILANATLLAQKDGRVTIDEVHIKKASRRITSEQNGAIKWVLAISSLVLIGFAFFQMSIICNSSQLYLWLLPIYSILWVIVVAYILRDFL
jgi:hypothetical protein